MHMEAKNDLTHIRLLVTAAIVWYSALAKERDTVVCFFILHDRGEPPNVTR